MACIKDLGGSFLMSSPTNLALDYAKLLVYEGVPAVIQDALESRVCKSYPKETRLTRLLKYWMPGQGWRSDYRTGYPGSNLYADIVSAYRYAAPSVTLELKEYVRNYPQEDVPGRVWCGDGPRNTIRQFLGVVPGKPNNAVDDVLVKLPRARTTHVAFLLVRIEACCNSGKADYLEFVGKAGLDDHDLWSSESHAWSHSKDPAYRFLVHIWIRPTSVRF